MCGGSDESGWIMGGLIVAAGMLAGAFVTKAEDESLRAPAPAVQTQELARAHESASLSLSADPVTLTWLIEDMRLVVRIAL